MRAPPSIIHAAVAALLLGCSDSTEPVPLPDGSGIQERPSSFFQVSPAAATIQQGQSRQFTTRFSGDPGFAAGPTAVTWQSSDPLIASVAPGGLVRGVSDGQVRIVATWEGYQASAVVTVTGVMKKHESPRVCLFLPTGHPGPTC